MKTHETFAEWCSRMIREHVRLTEAQRARLDAVMRERRPRVDPRRIARGLAIGRMVRQEEDNENQ